MYDVLIIGAGVIGCSIARELSKYKMKVCLLEKNEDVATGTSKANSAIVHAGFDAKTGTLKAKFNVKGNNMFGKLAKDLEFPFKRIGAYVLCFKIEDLKALEDLKIQGEANGVPGLNIISGEELRKIEPLVSMEVKAALYAPTSGICCPYEMTIALAENAYENGVDFNFFTEVKEVIKDQDYYIIKTNKRDFEGKIVINSAGLYADDINNMISSNKIKLIPRKGEYCLFDKVVGSKINSTIFQLPTAMGKGILVTPTVDGNMLIGPNASDIDDKEDLGTSKSGLEEVLSKAKLTLTDIPIKYLITAFTGLRAHSSSEDFIIGEADDLVNFINVASIESPGLSSAPAIGEAVGNIVRYKLQAVKKDDFKNKRKGILKFREMSLKDRKKIIAERPDYGKIICRCESVTAGEIIDALRRPLASKTLDGVKRRTRAGMGRCQAGFCTPKIVEIMAGEMKVSPLEITKFGGKSKILLGINKEDL